MAGNATPPPVPGTVDQYLAQLQNAVNGTGSASSSGDPFGVGAWKDQPIDPSGWPPAVALLLQQAGIDTSQKLTGAQLAQELVRVHNPGLVAQIQHMLFLAGAYPSSVKSMADLQVGIFGPQDIKALGDTITVAGQTGAPFGTYLTTAANYAKANGILNNISGAASNPVPQQSRANTDYVLRQMAQSLFGHDPTPDEYARFNAFYNQKLLTEAQDKTKAAQGNLPSNLPDTYSLGQAIGDLPQSQSELGGNLTAPSETVPFLKGPQRRSPDFADLTSPNPAYATYQQRLGADQSALSSVNSAAQAIDSGSVSTYTKAPDATAAAQEFLRQDNPGEIGAQNTATKYATLLGILAGTGR